MMKILDQFTIGNCDFYIFGSGSDFNGEYIKVSCGYKLRTVTHPWDNKDIMYRFNYFQIIKRPNWIEKLFGVTLEGKIEKRVKKTRKWLTRIGS